MAQKKPEPSPVELYEKHLEEATKNYRDVKTKHDDAAVGVYEAIAGKFKKLKKDDHKAVYDLLKEASVAYKRQIGILDPKGKVNDEIELGEVIRTLQQQGLSTSQVVKMFQGGEGKKVIDDLMDHYQQVHLQGRHTTWYHDKVGLNYDLENQLAQGHKKHHKSKDHVSAISKNLEQRIFRAAAQQANQ